MLNWLSIIKSVDLSLQVFSMASFSICVIAIIQHKRILIVLFFVLVEIKGFECLHLVAKVLIPRKKELGQASNCKNLSTKRGEDRHDARHGVRYIFYVLSLNKIDVDVANAVDLLNDRTLDLGVWL